MVSLSVFGDGKMWFRHGHVGLSHSLHCCREYCATVIFVRHLPSVSMHESILVIPNLSFGFFDSAMKFH